MRGPGFYYVDRGSCYAAPGARVEGQALTMLDCVDPQPESRRMRLTAKQIASLGADVEDDPAEVERAWEEEIRRRLDDVDAGTAELIPAGQVFAELRARVGQGG